MAGRHHGTRVALVLALAATAAAARVKLEGDAAAGFQDLGNAAAPAGQIWGLGTPANDGEIVNPVFMLRHDAERVRNFEALLWNVSTPGHPQYGAYLTREQAAALLPPVKGAQEAVLAWLQAHDVYEVSVSPSGDMIEAMLNVGTAKRMFDCEFHHFLQGSNANVIRATTPYTVPAELAQMLYVVGDLVNLPAVRRKRFPRAQPEAPGNSSDAGKFPPSCGHSCHGLVTPEVLKQAYSLPKSGHAEGASTTGMAVAEFQGVYYDATDLDDFTSSCKLETPVKVDRQIGQNFGMRCKGAMGDECIEALLDIEYIKATGGDIPLTDIFSLRYSLLKWARRLDSISDVPLVHSVSYGNDEAQQSSKSYMDACNAQFMKLGARGISVLFASGDQGVYGREGVSSSGKFNPDFPAASPYITAVGGTDFATKSVIGEETTWSDSGGGFSENFAAPPYQQQAVAGYKQLATSKGVLPEASLWNANGRGYPDVAALGGLKNSYCVMVGGQFTGVAGTSASCPVVAGMIARLNSLRAAKGQPPMGFLNPFIYQNPGAFQDVQSGKNTGGGPKGFAALKGWDPATGFGSPNYSALAGAALKAGEAAVAQRASSNVVVV